MTMRIVKSGGDETSAVLTVAEAFAEGANRAASHRLVCGMMITEHDVGDGMTQIFIECHPASQAVAYGLIRAAFDEYFTNATDED